MAEKALKSLKFPGLEDTYVVPSITAKEGEFENSSVLNDPMNQAIAPYSTAAGSGTRAGIYGYRLLAVNKIEETVYNTSNFEDYVNNKEYVC